MSVSSVSRRAKAGLAAVVLVPALVFAPTAVADDAGAGNAGTPDITSSLTSELPAGSLDAPEDLKALTTLKDITSSFDAGQLGDAVTVITAMLDAGVSLGDIVSIFLALQSAGVSIPDMLDAMAFLANNPLALRLVIFAINNGADISRIIGLIPTLG